ncbi:MAG: hypothetical protein RLZ17_1063, partial [Actinomycetota bacterium]
MVIHQSGQHSLVKRIKSITAQSRQFGNVRNKLKFQLIFIPVFS